MSCLGTRRPVCYSGSPLQRCIGIRSRSHQLPTHSPSIPPAFPFVFQVLSWNPRIVYYPNFMSPEICEHIRKIAQRRLTPSSLALRAGDTAENTKDVRTRRAIGPLCTPPAPPAATSATNHRTLTVRPRYTCSQGTFITGHDDPEGKLALVEKRIADVTLYPIENAEPFNVLKYEIGQKYDSHFDTFDPESYGCARFLVVPRCCAFSFADESRCLSRQCR